MKTKIAILVIAAAVLASFGSSKVSNADSKKVAQATTADANSTIGGIGEDAK